MTICFFDRYFLNPAIWRGYLQRIPTEGFIHLRLDTCNAYNLLMHNSTYLEIQVPGNYNWSKLETVLLLVKPSSSMFTSDVFIKYIHPANTSPLFTMAYFCSCTSTDQKMQQHCCAKVDGGRMGGGTDIFLTCLNLFLISFEGMLDLMALNCFSHLELVMIMIMIMDMNSN